MVTRMAELQRPSFRLEEYEPYLRAIARMQLHKRPVDGVGASDVVQETLFRAHRKLAQFRGNTEPQRHAWLKQILARVIFDERRKRPVNGIPWDNPDESEKHFDKFFSRVTSSTPSGKARKAEDRHRLMAALRTLLPDERAAVELRYLFDWKLTDIALKLDRPTTKAVSGLLARGLERLRQALRDTE
jgi:RNA polymerase sigma-70 factor (subfamily 1)